MTAKLVALLLIGWAGAVLAQGGGLAGKVEDDAGQALVGANVAVKGAGMPEGRGVSTDAKGKYQLQDLAPAIYEATASYVGHQEVTQKVEVKAGRQARLDFVLKSTQSCYNKA